MSLVRLCCGTFLVRKGVSPALGANVRRRSCGCSTNDNRRKGGYIEQKYGAGPVVAGFQFQVGTPPLIMRSGMRVRRTKDGGMVNYYVLEELLVEQLASRLLD